MSASLWVRSASEDGRQGGASGPVAWESGINMQLGLRRPWPEHRARGADHAGRRRIRIVFIDMLGATLLTRHVAAVAEVIGTNPPARLPRERRGPGQGCGRVGTGYCVGLLALLTRRHPRLASHVHAPLGPHAHTCSHAGAHSRMLCTLTHVSTCTQAPSPSGHTHAHAHTRILRFKCTLSLLTREILWVTVTIVTYR